MDIHTKSYKIKILFGFALMLSVGSSTVLASTENNFASNFTNTIQLAQANLSDQLKKQNTLNSDSIAIIYPDLPEPARTIFTKIIEGIEEQTKTKFRSNAITDKQEAVELYNQLKRNGAKVVIALGGQGLRVAPSFPSDLPVVLGGVISIPEGDSNKFLGISLTPDPALLFSHLKEISPGIKRVIVIYDPKNNEWLLKFARTAAKSQGIELITHEARDLASAARLYESVFASVDSKIDAIWLPQDRTTVDETTILPIVLKESWNRNIPIISSSPVHVKKGILFALQPNYIDLGHNLANSAMAILAGDASKRGMQPLRDVQTALNVRTASHIGLNIGSQQQRNFNFIYPEP